MRIEFDTPSTRSVRERVERQLIALLSVLFGTGRSIVTRAVSAGATTARWSRTGTSAVPGVVVTAATSRTTRRLARRLGQGILGVRPEWTAVAIGVAPVVAVVTEWWVVTTAGYLAVESWVVGTWTGTDPHLVVFVGVVSLVAVSAAYTAMNSGVIPATLLVMAPVFGIGFARYGLTLASSGTVGIPEATAFASLLAVAFGIPIGVTGFAVGTIIRRGLATRGEW